MRRITSKTALIFAFLVAVGWHQPVGATPANFLIQFSQTFPPISGGDSPRGHFSIDDSLLNTGLDQFVHLTAVADFEVVDGPASFPSGVWFGFLHISSLVALDSTSGLRRASSLRILAAKRNYVSKSIRMPKACQQWSKRVYPHPLFSSQTRPE
jgi:hypothetical protein